MQNVPTRRTPGSKQSSLVNVLDIPLVPTIRDVTQRLYFAEQTMPSFSFLQCIGEDKSGMPYIGIF